MCEKSVNNLPVSNGVIGNMLRLLVTFSKAPAGQKSRSPYNKEGWTQATHTRKAELHREQGVIHNEPTLQVSKPSTRMELPSTDHTVRHREIALQEDIEKTCVANSEVLPELL